MVVARIASLAPSGKPAAATGAADIVVEGSAAAVAATRLDGLAIGNATMLAVEVELVDEGLTSEVELAKTSIVVDAGTGKAGIPAYTCSVV